VERFKASRIHEAVVSTNTAGVSGFVTVHDINEEIVGDLPSAHEVDEPKIRLTGATTDVWVVDRSAPPCEELEAASRPGKTATRERVLYQTWAGLWWTFLGPFPAETDAFEWRGWRFEVVDMDGMRVDKVMLTLVPPAEEDERKRKLQGRCDFVFSVTLSGSASSRSGIVPAKSVLCVDSEKIPAVGVSPMVGVFCPLIGGIFLRRWRCKRENCRFMTIFYDENNGGSIGFPGEIAGMLMLRFC
jgi:hypothetical protein